MADTWSARARAEKLLEERDDLGRPLVFVSAHGGYAVHVIGPDEDQPGYEDIADYFNRRFRAVCGRITRLGPLDGYTGVFADDRLCRRCGDAFRAIGVDAGSAIFEDNTEFVQDGAPCLVARIQRDKRYDAERYDTGRGDDRG